MADLSTFSDSNENISISCISNSDSSSSEISPPTIAALRRLSENLEILIQSPDFNLYSDASIVINGGSLQVPVHRCILSARSPFFRQVFAAANEKGGKVELKEFARDFDVGIDSLVTVLSYLYSGKVKPLPEEVCFCVDDGCSHIACRPAVNFMVEVLYASFTFQIAELVTLYQRRLLDILDKVAIDDILVVLHVSNVCDKACGRLLSRCIEIVVKSDIDIVTLEKALPHDVAKKIIDSRTILGLCGVEGPDFPDKHVKRIHRALDSDDVELVRMLLKERHTTLDDAYALHYVVAFCDSKTTTELLDFGLADVNLKNPRGYTVLHVAAIRKEPKIIVSLLTKGARPSDLTLDGRKAIQICKRLTKSVDYYRFTEEGMDSPNDRLCIEILEQAERRDPLLGEASLSLAMAGDDLRSKLLYLESRVGLAKLLFPTEAKVAMEIAQVDGTSELPLPANSVITSANQATTMDLNDAPFKINEEHLSRLRALSKTVELGKRFFPRCSEVLNKIMDNDDLANLALENTEEQVLKKRRFLEIQSVLAKAFTEDKEEFDRSALSSASSSTSIEMVRSKLIRK
ncbi:BTB/POZ domain and ankyrin repeat-containing protein NPR1-like [Tasmannia lanceolata]|uniref:BTB/POZ domain and ankyrin repeat-containing protein NPR1-like n=1 Tax=Tasmannia lanceolata TaxID=3420 RepID=UPI004062DF9C